MSPSGEGYFYHQTTLKRVSIDEHARAVKERPQEFGIPRELVADLLPESNRHQLVELAWERGWVRVRHHRGHCGVEFRGSWQAAARVLRHIADDLGFGEFTTINLFNHDTMSGFEEWTWKRMRPLLDGPAEEIGRLARPIEIRERYRGEGG